MTEKLLFNEAVNVIEKNIFCDYYCLHTNQECINYFNLSSEHTFRQLLNFWEIERKNKQLELDMYEKTEVEQYYLENGLDASLEHYQLSGATFYKLLRLLGIDTARQKNKVELTTLIPKDALYKVYIEENRGVRYCAKYFNTTQGKIQELIDWYKIERKTQVQRKATRKNTDLLKYGVDHSSKDLKVLEKMQQTKLERYDNRYFTNRERAKETCLEKYGVENIMQLPEFRTTATQTMMNRYGVRAYPQTLEYHKKSWKKYYYNEVCFDSFPELAVYIYAIDHNIEIIRLPKRLSYTFEDKLHYYMPDFLYAGKLLEIKNDYLYNKLLIPGTKDNAKYNCMLKNDVEIWVSADYIFVLDYFAQKNYKKENFIKRINND